MDEAERNRRAEQARQAVSEYTGRGIDLVALTWVDNSGVTRVKAVPLAELPRVAAWGVGASPVFDTYLFDDVPVTGRFAGGPVGDLRLHPDLDRLTVLAAQPGWAWAPVNRFDQQGRPHPQDHRAIAARQVQGLADLGYHVRAAFELEWALSDGDGDAFHPATTAPAYGMARVVQMSDYVRDVVAACSAEGLRPVQIHPEYAPGQFELSLAATDPVGAADTFVLARETIRAVSRSHGLRATFSPKPVADGVGNGAHIHLSLWRDGRNAMAGGPGPFGLSGVGESFTSGLLAHLAGLLVVGAPCSASYLRLVPSHWAGVYACWGLENREAAVRLVTGVAGDPGGATNVEVKCLDAAANPYLVVAAVLAAGRHGIDTAGTLPPPVEVDPATLDEDTRRVRGITRLPESLGEAVAAFEADRVLQEAFGPELSDTLVAVRRGEIATLADATPEEVATRLRWVH